MLCQLAKTFPPFVADLLERDQNLTRNFREETVTDLLMASLNNMENFGIRVDFPDEPTTGGDMEWVFVAPFEAGGGRYLRVILQAKRAQSVGSASKRYWYYKHLDHGAPKGAQAKTLVSYAKSNPGGKSTCPMYILYHPRSALALPGHQGPAIEGVNLLFADLVAPVVDGGCGRAMKRVSCWRPHFMPLSALLCWPIIPRPSARIMRRDMRPTVDPASFSSICFHPDFVAGRLRKLREKSPKLDPEIAEISPSNDVPEEILSAILDGVTKDDRKKLTRPRMIFSTNIPAGILDDVEDLTTPE